MKSTLYLKFVVLYIIFGFLSVFTVSALFPPLITDYLEKDFSGNLYQEANLMAAEYLPGYFSGISDTSDVYVQLNAISSYLDATVWFIDREGEMLVSSRSDDVFHTPSAIRDFDPAETGGNRYIIGNYHGYFHEDVITVIAPVTQKFSIKGYLLIHKSYARVEESRQILLRSTSVIVLVIYLMSFIIFIGIHYFIYRPLRKISEAARQYSCGNLDVVIPVDSQDEMGYLSASLNYMASQLKDMEDYQKKFVANVSHDFRSPLTSIKGYVEAIADGTIPMEMQDKYLKIILFETERLTDLTEDLLTLNEFDTKDLLLDKTNFNIHEMIRSTAEAFEGTCTAKRISIELIFASRSLMVYADRRKIQQVLYNLLDNAIKFSDAESSITVETTERGDKVYTSVKDYGIGIPKQSLNKIWERFYKTDLSRGKDKKGTGLGLSIVKEAIQAHNENINVISTEGVGTEFIFSLPKGQ
ncbi:MAG: HAMP domain-containing protein [Coprococcus sp.]|nr:HAMP domain-containing protein [Coprococcus sp.]